MKVQKTYRLSELYNKEVIKIDGTRYGKVDDVMIHLEPGAGSVAYLKLKDVPAGIAKEIRMDGKRKGDKKGDLGIPFSKVISFNDVVTFGKCP